MPVLDTSTLLQASTPASNLHLNYYPQETRGHCTAGNENYSSGQAIGQPKSIQSRVPKTSPPAGVLSLDKKAGLLGTYR
jgi:hypothetical protein